MNNRTLLIIGCGIAVAFVAGHALGLSQARVTASAKPDPLWKRMAVAGAGCFGTALGTVVAAKVTTPLAPMLAT